MAATAITKTELKFNTVAVMPTPAAIDGTDGATVEYDKADHKTLLIFTNAAAATKAVKIKAGNGIQGVADLDFTLAANGTHCVVIESMKFVNVSGADKGKVIITGADNNVKVSAVVLP